MSIEDRSKALLLALGTDLLLGDPPNQWHPVVLLGNWMRLGERLAPQGARARLGWGAIWVGVGASGMAALARQIPTRLLLQAGLASTLLAYRGLDRAVGAVQAALAAGDLEDARRLLSWHLVSRDTSTLTAEEVAGAAIESLAENLSDSLVAPALAYLAGGLGGLVAYRLSNTADAMWGYHNDRYEYLGKAAARLDDLFNVAPARLTALLIGLAAQVRLGRGRAAMQVAWRDHERTASPNAGWPMAAMAGALDTTLTKRDVYVLGDGARVADAALIGEARWVARVAMVIFGLGVVFHANKDSDGASIEDFAPWRLCVKT